MKQGNKIYARYFSILCVLVAAACAIILPWAEYDGKQYTLYGFLHAVRKAGGISGFALTKDANIAATYYVTYLAAAALILYVIYGLLLILNRKLRFLAYTVYGLEFIYFTSYVIFQGHRVGWALPAVALLMVVEFLVATYCEQSSEINREYKLLKQREKEEKAERKRRLYFPGKFPPEFRKVIWTNFRYKWKNYVLFILCGVLCSTFLTVAAGMNRLLANVHSEEDIVLGTGMQQILFRSIGLILFTGVLLTAFVFSYYIKSRISDYRMFTVLGIRNKTLSAIIALEYTGSLLISLVCGMILGTVFLLFMRGLLVSKLGKYAEIAHLSPQIYVIAMIAYVLILLLATMINYESYQQIRESFGGVQTLYKEKIPKKYRLILTLVGLELMRESIAMYTEVSIGTAGAFLIGVFCFIKGGAALIVNWREESDRLYFKKLLPQIPFLYRFKKNVRYMVLLTAAHFLALNVYLLNVGGNLIAVSEEQTCPYDFVLMAHGEDQDVLEQIRTESQAEVEEYPMIRVSTPTGTSWDFIAQIVQYTPNGQYIGISETTYRKLCEKQGIDAPKTLNLKEHEVHAVLQQDSSFPIRQLDATPGTVFENPLLKMGRPSDPQEYETWNVKSYEVAILTGMFQRGSQENLIVFSDGEFEELYAGNPGGPTNLCLIQTSGKQYDNVDKALATLRERHADDEKDDIDIRVYYGKHQVVSDVTSERYSKEVLYVFVFLMFAVCALFLAYIKFSYDSTDICHRYRLFDCLGMKEGEQMKTIRKEMWPFAIIPLLISVAGSVVFHILTFGIRLYNRDQIVDYLKTAGVIGAVYIVIQLAWMACLVTWMQRKIRKNRVSAGRIK